MKYSPNWFKHHELEYYQVLAEQNYGCAICRVRDKPLVVDHDHKTKQIRGLLCRACNSWLGHHLDKETEEYLISALRYLEKPPASIFIDTRQCIKCRQQVSILNFSSNRSKVCSPCVELHALRLSEEISKLALLSRGYLLPVGVQSASEGTL